MVCWRTPKRKLRPSYLPFWKSCEDLMIELLEGARPAEPPISSGSFAAMSFSTCPEAARVARGFPSSKFGMVGSQDSGSSPVWARCHSAASAGFRPLQDSCFFCQAAWALATRLMHLRN